MPGSTANTTIELTRKQQLLWLLRRNEAQAERETVGARDRAGDQRA
jgi:hypothetical protein